MTYHKLCIHGRYSPKYASTLHNSLHSITCDFVTTNALDSTPLGVCDTRVTTSDKCYEVLKYLENIVKVVTNGVDIIVMNKKLFRRYDTMT